MKSCNVLLLCLIAWASVSLNGETFRNPYRIVTSVDPSSVGVGDFNNDGLPDLLWTDSTTTPVTIHVLLGQRGGSFLPGAEQQLPANVTAGCRSFDATNDSILDLVCPFQSTFNSSIVTFPGIGDGSFGSPIYSALPASSNYAGLSIFPPFDINSDAFPDLIVFNAGSDDYEVMLGDGRGGFRVVGPLAVSFLPVELPPAVVDVNGDGKPDLLIANGPNVMLGNGDGTFQKPTGYGTFPECDFKDMDGDGHVDAVCGLTLESGGDITGGTQLFIDHGNPDGSFNTTPVAVVNYGNQANAFDGEGTFLFPLVIEDQNNDGILDILAYAGDGLTVVLGKSGLTFKDPVHYAAGYLSENTFIGLNSFGTASPVDLNQDGIPDLVYPGPNGIYISYGKSDGTLETAPAYEVTQVIGYQTVADFNEDGIADLAATGDTNIQLSLGNGDGSFKPRTALPNNSIDFSTPLSATNAHIISGDFNGDHHQDIIAVGSSSIYQYDSYILFGKGNGTFTAPAIIPNTSTLFPMGGQTEVADANKDGRGDILSADYGHFYFALSNGDGTFKTVTTSVPTDVVYNNETVQAFPALADFDHDGKLDAAFGTAAKFYMLKGHGDGSFGAPGFSLPIPGYQSLLGLGAQAVTTGDFDGDGKPDVILLANYDQATAVYPSPTVTVAWVYYGNGDGTFSPGTFVAAFRRAYSAIYAADLNQDGRSDLILKTSGSLGGGYAIGIVHGLASRTFGPEVNYYAGTGLADISIADLNRDGFPDLLFSNGDYNIRASSVTVLMNLGNTLAVTGTLVAQPEPSLVGQAFQLIATLTPPQPGALSGPVEFYVDGKDLGAAQLADNAATLQAPATLTVGTHELAAIWQGNTTYPPVTLSGNHVVVADATSLTLTSSANPAMVGTAVTFTAIAASSDGSPTGAIVFSDDGTALATVPLLNGMSTFTTSALTIGSHTIKAEYAANGIYGASSAALTQVIDGIATTVNLAASPNPAFVGQSVQLTAKVAAQSGAPSGTVTFKDGVTTLGASTIGTNGVAGFAASFLNAGEHNLTASYSGDSLYNPSISASFVETIVVNASQTTVSISPNPALAYSPISFTAHVSISAAGSTTSAPVPTGTVTFYAGSTAVGSSALQAGAASVSTSTLGAGTYTVTAVYRGDAAFGGSTSQPVTLIVQRTTPQITLNSSMNPAVVGTNVTFSIGVSAVGHPGTGVVQFMDGTATLGSAALDAQGKAAFTTNQLALGTHAITAIYPGDANLLPGTSTTLQQQIVAYVGDFAVDVTPKAANFYTGESASFQVGVTPINGFNQPLTLSCAGLPAETTCTFNPSTLPNGQGQATLMIQSSAPHKAAAAKARNDASSDPHSRPSPTAGILAGLAVCLLPTRLRKRYARWASLCWIGSLLIGGLLFSTGCGKPSPITGGTPPGIYSISVTASTSGSGQPLTHASVVTLTVKSLF